MSNHPALEELARLMSDRLVVDKLIRDQHGHDVSRHQPQPPDAVAYPTSSEDVAQIVRVCSAHRLPVIPYGTGTAVEGGVVAHRRGVCIDLSRMNQVLRISSADQDALVQAGVTRYQLNRELEEKQTALHFSVDPGADASLGGMAATSASGSSAVRYGTMKENVLGLTVVLASGEIIKTGGRARKSSAGYDLTHLFIGSEGTLGVITELTLRLHHQPAAMVSAVCPFPSIDSAVASAIHVISNGIPLARLELLDEIQMQAVNRYSNLSYVETPTLFFEFHGSQSTVEEQARDVSSIVSEFAAGNFEWASDEAARKKLWQARYDAYYASLAIRPEGVGYVTDVCVPISELATCIGKTKQYLAATSIPCPLFGHVGDGNYHVVFVIDPDSAGELREVQEIHARIVDDALQCGGTCSGEHGIGIGKLDALTREHPTGVPVMRAIKSALDPQGIMNPGKVLES